MEELEALKAELEELKKSNEVLLSDKKKILDEKKKLQAKTDGVDIEKYFAMTDELEMLKAEHAKVTKLSKLEIEKLTSAVSEKDKSIHKLIVSDAIIKELSALGIDDFDTHAHRFERNATVENGVALVGGKPLNEAVSEWASSDSGKRYIQGKQGIGGGASGGGSNSGNENYKRSEMTHSQKGEYIAKNGQDAYFKLPN